MPNDDNHAETGDERGLVRAADLIGQLADPRYPQKLNALFHEFVQTGTAKQLDLAAKGDMVGSQHEVSTMSALPQTADLRQREWYVRYVP